MSAPVHPAPPTSRPVDEGRAVATVVVAFSADPIVRWFFPDSTRFLAHFPRIVRLMGNPSFTAGTADLLESDTGAALWVPPEGTVDEDGIVELVEHAIDPPRLEGTFAFLGQMEEHHPTEPHWYLPFIGVDPAYQGRGYGSTLLERGLARVDRDGLPAYLEATSPRNRALYARHGFVAFGEIQADDSPPMWPMLRPPR